MVVIYALKHVPMLLLLHNSIHFYSFTAERELVSRSSVSVLMPQKCFFVLVWFFHVKCAEIQIDKHKCLTNHTVFFHTPLFLLLAAGALNWLLPSFPLFLPLFPSIFFLFLLLADPETLFSLTIQCLSVLLIHLPHEATTHPNNLRQHLFRCKY